jgi:hypothetical protein
MKDWKSRVLVCGLALGLPGCIFVDGDDAPPALVGTVTVDWTIAGGQDPRDCRDFGVDRFELVIFDGPNSVVDEIEPYCEDFSVSLDLFEGRYFAEATLVDSFDDAVTLTETIDAIDVIDDTELVIPIDFSPGSFL